MKPRTLCKQGHPLRHEDGTLTANAHRRRDARGVECQTCKHGKVPKAALLRAQGLPTGLVKPRLTTAARKVLAEQKAQRKAQAEADEQAHLERLAAGRTTDGVRDDRPKASAKGGRPKPERKKITDDLEWQRRNKAQREGRPLEPDQ